jgi:hypothetical protein
VPHARLTGWGAAALTAVLVTTASPALALEAAPTDAPAEPAPTTQAVAAAAVGNLTVTSFDDYYADGVFDTSKTAADGGADRRNTRLYEAITSAGTRVNATQDADGDFVFTDLPVGETKVYFLHPNSPDSTLFFDATGAAGAGDIERLPNGSHPVAGTLAVATVNVDEDGEELSVGFAAAGAQVAVKNPDGTPATGLTGIEFGSAGSWTAASEYAGLPGTYAGGPQLPDEIGLRLQAPAGYRIAEVVAVDGASWPARPLTVTERAGGYWIDTVELAPNAPRADFTVTLEALPTGDLTVTAFDDYYADGLFDTSKTAVTGDVDRKDAYRVSEALTSTGQRAFGTIDADGDYVFTDLPVGETKVYFTHPNAPESSAFFDATGATSAADIERLPNGPVPIIGTRAIATVNVDEDGEAILVGFSAAQAQVAVENADGTPVPGLTDVEFGSGGQWFDATEYAGLPGTYAAGAHVPDEIGVRLTAPAGYEIDEVTALDSISARALAVTERDGGYWIDSVGLSPNAARADFTVTLAELPTGTLTVTAFDDYYADGLFDTSKTALDGNIDRKDAYRVSEALTSTGQRAFGTIDADGDYVFTDLPVGETKIYFTHPNNPDESVFFDATGATSAADIERLPNGPVPIIGTRAIATVNVDEDGEALLVGFSAMGANVAVTNPDGTPATGLTGVEFGSGGEWFAGSEYAGLPGSYEALVGFTGIAHLPDEIGLRLTPPAGYEIDEVTATDNVSSRVLEVTERDGAWWIDTVDLGAYFSTAQFAVALAEEPTAELAVTYFADVVLDGVFDPADDAPLTAGTRVYLNDADGDWWATTAGADGMFRFPGAAIGPATIYTQLPETPDAGQLPADLPVELPDAALAVWDATDVTSYRDTVEAPTEDVTFQGELIDPVTGTTTPITVSDERVAAVAVDLVEGEQERFIGAASILQFAIVGSVDSAPSSGAQIEFFANGQHAASEEAAPASGTYVATEEGDVAVFGTAEYGISVTPAEGFEVVDVQALSLDGQPLELAGAGASPAETDRMAPFAVAAAAEYRVSPEQLTGPFNVVLWAVQVAPAAVPPVDGPSVGDPGADLPRTPAAVSTGTLPATGSAMDPWAWMLLAAVLVGAGVMLRTVRVRRG